MAGFLTDLAKTCVERVIYRAITESRYLCCFTCIAKEFEEEKTKLKAERETMAQRFDVAAQRDKDIQRNALFWKEQVDMLLQEDTTTKQTCLFGFCLNCMWRYKRGKELANKMEEIKREIEKGEKLENVELPRCLPGVEYYSSQYYISFKSRELKYKELLDALKDDTNYITGLQGMGGTGKTTLAKQVGKELKQSKQFVQVIDTTMSFTPDIKKIQDDIAGPLGLKWEDCSESDRPKKLWSRLTNGEKILLILDDVWGHIDFKQIGIPHSDDPKGCRVLVTTRDLQVCNKMGCGKTIQLELLSKEDAWIMFKRHAHISDSSPKSLLEKGRKIADECKGLLIAIAFIASSLKGQQRREEWDVALKSLQNPLVSMHGVGDDNLVQIYKCLKFSYDYLKDEKAKGLFLLCSVFREDEEISTETLARLGIGSGLFGEDYDKYDDARMEVVVAKNKLLDSCLLLKGNGGRVKMHDLVRDAAHLIADKKIQAINLSKINQKSFVERENNIKYLFCEGKVMDVTSCRIDGSKLEILLVLFNGDEDCHDVQLPDLFFENKAGLRVLHLSKHYGFSRWALSLPQSFQSLVNIRSLLIDGIILGDISILGNLQSLETLDLLYCTIDELPLEITTLKNFRLLRMIACVIRRDNPFEVIKRCSSLEELYFEHSFERLCGEATFPMLQRYHVVKSWGIGRKSLSKCVHFAGNEKNDEFYFSEATIKYWMQTAEFLRLERIHRGWPWRNLIPDIVPIDQGMNDLIELHLDSISQLQCLIDTKHIIDSRVQSVFYKLVVLKLSGIENLEELCNGPLSSDSLKSLEVLKIRNCKHLRSLFECKLNLCNLRRVKLENCPMLISVFQLPTSRSLVLLEKLEITNCEQLKHIIVDERREEESGEEMVDGDNDHKSHGSMFHKLKVLRIGRCPQLEFILSCLSARDVPVLETIWISVCDELKYIFGQYQDVELGSLKELFLDELPNFIDIFSECYHPMSSPVKESSSRDGSKAQKQLDPIKHNIFSWTHICCYVHKHTHKLRSTRTTKIPLVSKDQLQDSSMALASNCAYCLHTVACAQYCLLRQPHILCFIKEIRLKGLSKIKSVFTLSIAPRMLLETLIISRCGELKHIIMATVDDNGGKIWGNIFPKLKELYIKDCGQLEYIFGCYTHDNQNHNEIHLHLPALECLMLNNLPSLVDMSPKNYGVMLPLLTDFKLKKCSQVASKSIRDFIDHSVSRSLDNTSVKDLSENVEHFLALKNLEIRNSNAENIFCAGEINGQQMNLGLQKIRLYDMPQMTYLFLGPKDSFALRNLMEIKIMRCENLKMLFSSSISRCLPQLLSLIIVECKELKQIIEEDVENPKMSNSLFPTTCFPTLQALVVANCNKLECVFPASICKELPKLKVMLIIGADALEEIFRCEGDQKVEIPNLKLVVFVRLSNLNRAQGTHFQAVENRFIRDCQKLSLTSAVINSYDDIPYGDLGQDYEMGNYLRSLLQEPGAQSTGYYEFELFEAYFPLGAEGNQVRPGRKNKNNCQKQISFVETKPKQTPKEEHEFVKNVPGLEIPSIATSSANSEDLWSEQSMSQHCLMNQRHPPGETDTTFKFSQGNNCLKKTEDQSIQECSESETEDQSIKEGFGSKKTITAVLSTNSEIRNDPPIPLVAPIQKGIKRSFEEGAALANAKTVSSSNHSKLVGSSSGPLVTSEHEISSKEDGGGQIAIPSFSTATTKPHAATKSVDVGDSKETTETYAASDDNMQRQLGNLFIQSLEDSEIQDASNENPSAKTIEDFPTGHEVQVASGYELTSSQCLKEMEDQSIQEDSMPEKTVTTILSTNSERRNEPPMPLVYPIQEGINSSVEEGTTSIYAKTKTLSTHSKSVNPSSRPIVNVEPKTFLQEDGDGQMAIPSFSIAIAEPLTKEVDVEDSQKTAETNDSVSLDDDVSMKVSPIIDEQFSKNDEIRASESMPSPSIPSPIASHRSPSMPCKGNPPHIVEDPCFSSLVTRELEQLVSKKYLASEKVSLLINFLVKYPSVRLPDNSLSNRYKGYAYSCLAELLKFLQTHSVLDVLGSSHSEFVELLQDMRSFAFDKNWLDSVERRAMFPGLQVSQEDLQKLLDSKQRATKEVEELHLKIGTLTQQMEDLKHQLTSSETILKDIIQQESQVSEAITALSIPLSY